MSSPRAFRDAAGSLMVMTIVLAACGGSAGPDTAATEPPPIVVDSNGPTAPVLAGTTWQVFEYVPYDGESTSLLPGTEITLRFRTNGTLDGTAGCNDYEAQFEVAGDYDEFVPGERSVDDGQSIHISDVSHTERVCEPTGVLEQESAYLELLGEVGRWLYARDSHLFLRDDAGRLLLGARPAG